MNPIKTFSFVLLAGLLGIAQANEAAAPAAPAGDAAAGKAKAVACGACHNPDGNSVISTNPKLAGQGAQYIAKQLQDFKSGKRANPIMMGMAGPLSDQDILDIAAYFAAQKSSTSAADPAQVQAGEKVWRGGNLQSGVMACTGCHGPSGRGNLQAAYPALRGQHADYVEIQLKAFRGTARGDLTGDKRENDPEGMMRGVAKNLSDSEIKALAQFVTGLYQ